jgi:DNA-binding CsgD family transcriptional regulator
MLQSLGLGSTAEQVYRAMLRDPQAGLAGLLDQLRLPEGEVRAALDELVRLSLLRQSWEDPDVMVPVNPEVGLAALLSRGQQELAMRQRQIEASRTAVASLLADYADVRPRLPDPDVERLSRADAVRARLEELAHTCSREVSALRPGGARPEAGESEFDQAVLGRGITLRAVYLESVANDRAALDRVRWLADLGAEVRTAAVLPSRMLIVDREVGLVLANAGDSHSAVLQVNGGGLIVGLCALFDSVWRGATPLYARRRPRDPHGLSNQERAILDLLGQGLTDDAVARRLEVSVRTCRRVIAELMERLAAQSRFQAGALAQAGGWLDHPTTVDSHVPAER